MTEWNDGRLDDLSDRVGRIEKKMDEGFARLDRKIDALSLQMLSLHRMLTRVSLGVAATVIAAFIGLIATQV